MNKTLQKVITFFYLAAVFIPAALSFGDVYRVEAQAPLNITLQQDPSVMADASLETATPSTNYGTDTSIYVGESNSATNTTTGLLRFDLSVLPANITITSATLSLWVRTDKSDNARTMRAIPFIKNQVDAYDWLEASATNNATRSGGTVWGGIALGSEIGNVAMANNVAANTKVDITLTPDAIRQMIFDNYWGFKLVMDTNSNDQYLFYSSDETTHPEYRPMLYLEYTLGDTTATVTWECIEPNPTGSIHGCGDTITPLTPIPDPITIVGGRPTGVFVPGGGKNEQPSVGLFLDCTPYPQCKNDYKIYYKIDFNVSWSVPSALSNSTPQLTFSLLEWTGANTTILTDETACGVSGIRGSCLKSYEGVIETSDLTIVNKNTFDFRLDTTFWPVDHNTTVTILHRVTFSLLPIVDNCSNIYTVPEQTAHDIDPTIETPAGTPTDDQIYPTSVGNIYMIRAADGPWNDGVNDRKDIAVSVDGSTWQSLDEFSASALCVDFDSLDPDYILVYFTATTTSLHVRANDVTAAFADNTNDPGTPLQYKIGQAFKLAQEANCEAQFAYDSGDLVHAIILPSTSDDFQATTHEDQPLEPGGWYAITVTSGTWNEPAGPGRVDMEFEFTGGPGGTDWADLAAGSSLAWCTSSDGKTVYVQAPGNSLIELHLRVNDQDSNFANNSGLLNVSISHATFTRLKQACELQFDLDNQIVHDTVDGNQSAGKAFGKYPTQLDLVTLNGQGLVSIDTGDRLLSPGAWYMLETSGGPWTVTTTWGDRTANTPYYDMQIKVGTTDWADLDTWAAAQCIVPTDTLGHVRVYFKVPNDTTLEDQSYLLRVASNAFMFTRGDMTFDLYGAVDLGYDGLTGDCTDYKYDPNARRNWGTVNSATSAGTFIQGLGTGAFFAIRIESADAGSGWQENATADEQDDLQLSTDGGETWDALPNSPAVLCYYNTPGDNELVIFIRTSNGQQWKLRANSTTFNDNIGNENYTVFDASPGNDVNLWTSCIQSYPLNLPAINPHEWIPVDKADGALISSLAQYAEYNGLLAEGAALPPEITQGALSTTSSGYYVLEIEYGTGPWDDGETDTQHYDAQLSNDNGAIWETLNSESTIVPCVTVDQLRHYYKALIHVTTGQVWKIRVADDATTTFTDNGGNLAYILYTAGGFEVPPADNSNIGYINVQGGGDVCDVAPVSPGALSLTEISSLGSYLGEWISFANLAIERYMAFCPRHVDMFFSVFDLLKKKEPFATLTEFGTMEDDIKRELQSYGWDGQTEDLSFIWGTKSSSQIQSIVDNYALSSTGGGDPWADGADLVNLTANNSLPSSYAACVALLPEYKRFANGFCFASSMMKETSAQFWIQLSFDVGMMFVVFKIVMKGVYDTISMATGVALVSKALD